MAKTLKNKKEVLDFIEMFDKVFNNNINNDIDLILTALYEKRARLKKIEEDFHSGDRIIRNEKSNDLEYNIIISKDITSAINSEIEKVDCAIGLIYMLINEDKASAIEYLTN